MQIYDLYGKDRHNKKLQYYIKGLLTAEGGRGHATLTRQNSQIVTKIVPNVVLLRSQ